MEKTFNIPYKFKCRPYQYDAWHAIREGKKRIVCCWHRGCGKDLLFLNALITQMVKRPGVYLHCFPKYSQGKRAIWTSVHETHEQEMMPYLDHIPKELVKSKNGSDMTLQLFNGSVYSVMGLDGKNATQARGMNPCFIILSEYAYMDPESWYTIEPRISQNKGTAVFLSTPNGQNHFYNLFNHAKNHPDQYFSSLLTIDDTRVLDHDHIERLRSEGLPEDFIQQEYYCSFTRGAEGSYYGKHIQKARDEDRITRLPIVPDLPCATAWDIGIGDSTSIWIFQQLQNNKVNCLHYYENHGEGLEHYVKYLKKWQIENNAIWSRHFVPHDMANKQFATGNDLVFSANQMGLDMTVVPKKSIEEGIQAVRSLLPQCSFEEKQCKRGIQCLDFYRKKWNDVTKTYYDEPYHDQWSHGADAFRYLAVGLKNFGVNGSNTLSADQIKDMHRRNLGWNL